MTEDTDEDAKKLLNNEIRIKPAEEVAPGEAKSFDEKESQAERDAD